MARRSFIYAGLGLVIAANLSPLAAQEPILRITKADCARLVEAAQAGDVTYQPDIDVRGRSVVAADLGGSGLEAPGQILIHIGIELAERLGIPRDPSNFDADAEIGVVEVRDKHAYFNGQPLQGEAEAELAAKCRDVSR